MIFSAENSSMILLNHLVIIGFLNATSCCSTEYTMRNRTKTAIMEIQLTVTLQRIQQSEIKTAISKEWQSSKLLHRSLFIYLLILHTQINACAGKHWLTRAN